MAEQQKTQTQESLLVRHMGGGMDSFRGNRSVVPSAGRQYCHRENQCSDLNLPSILKIKTIRVLSRLWPLLLNEEL